MKPIVPLLLLVLSASSFADTFTVGSLPGDDFADLASAIAAAQSGDRLELRSEFFFAGAPIDKSLTIVGAPGTRVRNLMVQFLPLGEQVVLADFEVEGLKLLNSDGTILLDNLFDDSVSFESEKLRVSDATDVRIMRSSFEGWSSNRAARIIESRVEAVDCLFRGQDVLGFWECDSAPDAGRALDVFRNARFHMVGGEIRGGDTTDVECGGCFFDYYYGPCGAGDAAVGIRAGFGALESGTELLLYGPGLIEGGDGSTTFGDNNPYTPAAVAFSLNKGFVYRSDMTIAPGTQPAPLGTLPAFTIGPTAVLVDAVTPEPVLRPEGFMTPNTVTGPAAQVRLHATPGRKARIWMGRAMHPEATPGELIERLVTFRRVVYEGFVGPTGLVVLPVRPQDFKGDIAYFQAEVTDGAGGISRTNSVGVLRR